MPVPKLSIVIPAYNEAERFTKTLPLILKFFTAEKYTKEIIIVDDGSSDNTVETVKQLSAKSKLVTVISHQKNRGKGAGLRTGILASKGQWVLFMDADLSTPLKELDNFWQYTKDYDVIIGSRKTEGATIEKHQSFVRENLGKVFTFLTNTLATKGLSDITCGFKMFRGPVARKIFKLSQLDDWSYDSEILFLAQKFNHPIKEVPVSWENDPRTKVNILKDGTNALLGLFKIRINNISGKY